MYPADIGRLTKEEVDLKEGSVFWDREKEPENPFLIHHMLWPETRKLVARYFDKGNSSSSTTLDYRSGKPVEVDIRHFAFLDKGKAR